jgi:hypothetical protein
MTLAALPHVTAAHRSLIVDAPPDFLYVDLDAQEAPQQPLQIVEFEDIDTIDPLQFADLLAANERQLSLPEEDMADAIEIELTSEQMDGLLQGNL